MLRSSRWRSTTCSAGIFFSSGSATTIAASHAGDERLALVVEFDRAGAIEKRIAFVHEFRFGDIQLHAHRMRAGFGRSIADRRAVRHRARLLHVRRCGRGLLQAGWFCRWRTGRRSQSTGGPFCVHCRSYFLLCLDTGSSKAPIAAAGKQNANSSLLPGSVRAGQRPATNVAPLPEPARDRLRRNEVWQGPLPGDLAISFASSIARGNGSGRRPRSYSDAVLISVRNFRRMARAKSL